ncbi:hypothetical protein HYX03_02505 [Candidatus Woesearchaeota archaeon]|nr:hypothetical protein [Candidatus Woesearchaeota archaeon]
MKEQLHRGYSHPLVVLSLSEVAKKDLIVPSTWVVYNTPENIDESSVARKEEDERRLEAILRKNIGLFRAFAETGDLGRATRLSDIIKQNLELGEEMGCVSDVIRGLKSTYNRLHFFYEIDEISGQDFVLLPQPSFVPPTVAKSNGPLFYRF